MHISFIQMIALLTTCLLFGTIGFQLSRLFKRPVSVLTWIFLILAILIVGGIMPSAVLIGIFKFKIFVSHSLQALGLGIVIGLLIREIRVRMQVH